ncbi:MAG TPA: energy transducer TonB [Candidatus Saccharimonadales bacterium]|nr:energy transducer TonB [Candidatus Saccharimonadales bacterium]
MGDLADQFSRALKRANAKVVFVDEFLAPGAGRSQQGEYFTSFVATILKSHNQNMTVATLQKREPVAAGSSNSESAAPTKAKSQRIEHIVPEYLVTGTIETSSDTYTVHAMVRRAQDNSLLIEQSAVILRSEFADSLSEAFPPQTGDPVVKKVGAKRLPQCKYCPNPSYNERARAAHVEGTCVFEVLISLEGRAVKMHSVRQIGYGLDEQAFNAIKSWKFKPATDDQGDPIPVIVPIEVTFRLY